MSVQDDMNPNVVFDPKSESAEFCLDCFRKHTGKGLVNIKEVIERFRQNPNYDDPENLQFIWLHADKAMNEFAEAEEHVNKVNKNAVDEKTLQKLGELGHEARTIRDQIRHYVKTIPNKNSDNYNELLEKIKSKDTIPRIDYLWDAKLKSEDLRPKIHTLTADIGCGDCMATKEDLEKVDKALEEILKNEQIQMPKAMTKLEKKEVFDAEVVEIIDTAASKLPVISNKNDDIPDILKKLELPALNDLLKDIASGVDQKVLDTQIEHVKSEVKNIPVLFLNDIITAFFGNPLKK